MYHKVSVPSIFIPPHIFAQKAFPAMHNQIASSCRNSILSWVDEYRTGSSSDWVGVASGSRPSKASKSQKIAFATEMLCIASSTRSLRYI